MKRRARWITLKLEDSADYTNAEISFLSTARCARWRLDRIVAQDRTASITRDLFDVSMHVMLYGQVVTIGHERGVAIVLKPIGDLLK